MKIFIAYIIVLILSLFGGYMYVDNQYSYLYNKLYQNVQTANGNNKILQTEILELQKQVIILKKRKPVQITVQVSPSDLEPSESMDKKQNWTTAKN